MFQMGDNLNLFDFVTLKNVVHAHLLAADRLDAPPLPASVFADRLDPVQCTVKRRRLPTSQHPDVVDPATAGLPSDPPLPAMRTKWNQFSESALSSKDLTVAGQAFFITNGEPVNFWTFARAVYYAYSGRAPRWWDPLVFPKEIGMLYASLSETIGWFQGKKPEDCAVPKAYMQYVLHDLYFDIERVSRPRFLHLPRDCPIDTGPCDRHAGYWATNLSKASRKVLPRASRSVRRGPFFRARLAAQPTEN